MKKFLLSLAVMLGVGSLTATAADVTITAAQIAGNPTGNIVLDGNTYSNSGYSFTFNANGKSTKPQYYETTSDVRMYKSATVKISGSQMTKMVFTLSDIKRASDVTASTGTMSYDVAGKLYTWTGNATEVTFTVPEKSNSQATEPDNVAQFRWNQVVITTDGAVTPTSQAPVFEPKSGTIIPAGGLAVTITAGEGASIYYTTDGTNPTTSSDVYRAPILLTQATTIKAMAVEEGKEPSAVVSAEYKAPAATVANIKAFLDKADTENIVVIEGPVVVSGEFTYGSGQSLYVQDETGYMLIFDKGKTLHTYQAGDRISNFAGTYSVYNQAAQMIPESATFGTAVAGDAPEATTITVTEPTLDQQNKYVKLSNVAVQTSTENDKEHYAVSGSDQILLFNRFNITFPEDGNGYDVYGYVSAYFPKDGDPIVQIYPAEIREAGQEPVKHEAATIAEFLEAANGDTNNVWTITGDVKTVYQNRSNLYIQDVEAPYTGLLIYGNLDKTYAPGTILSGIKGTWTDHYSTIEMTAQASSFTDGTEGTAPVCTEMDVENVTPENQNLFVEFKNVNISGYDETTKAFTITDAKDATFEGYNKWYHSVEIPADAAVYNVKGFISYYQAKDAEVPALQFYPIEFTGTTGVDGIATDDNVTAEYYTIDGLRVSEPENGIYIVRRGDKVSKIIVHK